MLPYLLQVFSLSKRNITNECKIPLTQFQSCIILYFPQDHVFELWPTWFPFAFLHAYIYIKQHLYYIILGI